MNFPISSKSHVFSELYSGCYVYCCHLLNIKDRIPCSFQHRSTRIEILMTWIRPVHLTHGMWIVWNYRGQSNSERKKNITLKGYFLVNVKSWFKSYGENFFRFLSTPGCFVFHGFTSAVLCFSWNIISSFSWLDIFTEDFSFQLKLLH